MLAKAPTGNPASWTFDPVACWADLDAYEQLLVAKPDVSERDDILPFFREHPHLAAFLGSYNSNVTAYNRLGVEVGLFGRFAADVVAGDWDNRAYCFVEFEEGRSNSIFVSRGRQATEWAPRFEHGFGQIVDWLWLLDDQDHTLTFEEHFGPRPIDLTALLIAGRDGGVSVADRRRLKWREKHVVVNSHHIYCYTFDDLLRSLRRRLALWSVTIPPPP